MPTAVHRRGGLSLIEVIIVIIIIGVLAAIVIPRFSPATNTAVEAALAANIRIITDATDRYTAEHNARGPDRDASGNLDNDGEAFVRRLLERTDLNGKLVADGPYGPYLHKFPVNPINGKDTLRVGPPAAGANTHGWHYERASGEVRSDDGEGYATFSPQDVGSGAGPAGANP